MIPRYKNNTLTKSLFQAYVLFKSFEHPPYCKDKCYSQHQSYLFFLKGDFIHIGFSFHHLNVLFVFFIGLNFRFSSYDFNILFVFFIDFVLGSVLELTPGLSFSLLRLILKLVPILKPGDDISILLL